MGRAGTGTESLRATAFGAARIKRRAVDYYTTVQKSTTRLIVPEPIQAGRAPGCEKEAKGPEQLAPGRVFARQPAEGSSRRLRGPNQIPLMNQAYTKTATVITGNQMAISSREASSVKAGT